MSDAARIAAIEARFAHGLDVVCGDEHGRVLEGNCYGWFVRGPHNYSRTGAETDRGNILWLLAQLRQAQAELDACRRRCEGLAERVAKQSDLLTRRAEK